MRFPVLIAALLCAVPVAAQAQRPSLAAVWPPVCRPGAKVQATLEGSGLEGATQVLVSGQGVTAELASPGPEGLPVTLIVAPDAPPGSREIRVVTPKGMSPPGCVWVGPLPHVAEREPNDQPEKATPIEGLPVTVIGRADTGYDPERRKANQRGEDVDWFLVKAAAGETLVFDVTAARICSPIDPFLELRDEEGRLLAIATEGFERDPRLAYTFKRGGAYRLQVRDTMYRGGPGFVYAVSIGRLPAITALFPPGGRRGEVLAASLAGTNLGAAASLAIPLPAEMRPEGLWWVAPTVGGRTALPVAVTANDLPQFVEPLRAARPPVVSLPALPVTVNGRIDGPREADAYQFALRAGQQAVITVRARSHGSRMDPFVRVLDASGKELMNSEEQVGREPTLVLNPPSPGTYRVEITSIDNKGGPDYTYRATILVPGTPDFSLTATPDIVSPGRGQTMLITVAAARTPGFDAPITLAVEGLPPGVEVVAPVIPAGRGEAQITLTAPADRAVPPSLVRVVGTARVEGREIRRVAEPWGILPRPGEGQPAPRPVEFQAVWTTDEVPLYTLALEPRQVSLKPGESVTLKVRAHRKPNDGNANPAIALEVKGLPPQISVEAPPIPEKAAEGTIKLTAVKEAPALRVYALVSGKLGENVQHAPGLAVTVAR